MAAARTPTCYRWIICALLFAATTINYIDRQILSLVKPLLDQELHRTLIVAKFLTDSVW